MKKTYSLLFIVLSSILSFGQDSQLKKADELFNTFQYIDAIDAYSKIANKNIKNTYVYKQLADSYYQVFNVDEASKWYAKAIEDKQDAETYYRYAQMLKSQGKYKESNLQMDTFSKLLPNDQRAIAHLKNPTYIPQLADQSKLFTDIKETTINSKNQSDFGAFLTDDNILYFVSARNTGKKEDKWTNMPYLDIYKSVRNENGDLSKPEAISDLNTPYHDGPITLSADGKTMFFSRDGHSEGLSKRLKNGNVKLSQQGIYKATFIDGKWANIEPLPINSKEYTVTHPSLSSDGKTLYFASNMPGGLGNSDIWKISINGNSYSSPENLGPRINTSGKEGFPFISENNILYFSSNGRQGFGGLDIFKVELLKNENPVHLGNEINTKSDDFAFSINTAKKIAYFSSNRTGKDNIYSAVPICQFEVLAMVKDAKNNAKIADAKIVVLDTQNNPLTTQNTNNNGQSNFLLHCDDYTLTISKEGYKSETITIPTSSNNIEKEIALHPLEIKDLITETEVKLDNIYFEFNKSNITLQGASELDKLVTIMKEYPKMKIFIKSHTDSKGSNAYNLALSESRAQATMHYVISKGIDKNRLSAKGMGYTEPKVNCQNCTVEEDALNRRSEFLILEK